MTRRRDGRGLRAIIADLNRILQGWFGYFKHSCRPIFPRLDGWIRRRLRAILLRYKSQDGHGDKLANQNAVSVRYVQADLFAWLRDVIPNGERFDVVVLDPAKLTRDRETVDQALRKYCDMNRLALQVVAPGGIFLTCSCTGLVSESDFLESLRRAAWQAGRTLQIFKVAGAAPDHPFLLSVPEGRYLKAIFCRVE